MLFKFSTDVFEPLGEFRILRSNPAVWVGQRRFLTENGIDVFFPIDWGLAGKVEDALKGVTEDEARQILGQKTDYVVLPDGTVLVFVDKNPSVRSVNDSIDCA
jgi:hypothetical protein